MVSELHEGHRDRMKNRFRKYGIDSLEDHEKLEIFLFSIFPRINTNELSHNLIKNFGSLKNVLSASESQLENIKGIGPTGAFYMNYIGALMNYLEKDNSHGGICLDTTKKIGDYARELLDMNNKEQVLAMFLDKKRMLTSNLVVDGLSSSFAEVDRRSIIRRAVKENSVYVVLAHSHLGEVVIPSASDIIATRSIFTALASVDVQLDDHVIVDYTESYSMRFSDVFVDIWKR